MDTSNDTVNCYKYGQPGEQWTLIDFI